MTLRGERELGRLAGGRRSPRTRQPLVVADLAVPAAEAADGAHAVAHARSHDLRAAQDAKVLARPAARLAQDAEAQGLVHDQAVLVLLLELVDLVERGEVPEVVVDPFHDHVLAVELLPAEVTMMMTVPVVIISVRAHEDNGVQRNTRGEPGGESNDVFGALTFAFGPRPQPFA